ncbi:MAG: flagellar biosynthesis protein FlhB [Sulfurimicrobium sp.]|jgi:flagellar biosynthetic protein FlhB|nr:flagellar biosynthesis protein FlhB [Sulfurimicrobium sp.]MDP1705212.1 flagellar biosynthesis protein FlhB [Sulfurimicrobium sp.]MDP2199146.1 flagellar biosynthesis protein FlhB [Sulfurimicrobium sp.]MDP2962739.1 flagellar biosynthesis protein FlhB [Sulfurimicrobium sp.]MDP3689110.1 flagellar biosynthesis protein FlhB [Sulfurimicrobium sp.]
MAEDSDLERTEPATPRRIEQAREKGQVAHSRELTTVALLLAAGGGLIAMGDSLMEHLRALMRNSLTLDRNVIFNPDQMLLQLHLHSLDILLAILPFLGLMMVVTVASSVVISGWLLSAQALEPNFSRLNPLKGLTRIVSWSGLVEMLKAVAKSALIGGIALWVVWEDVDGVVSLVSEPLEVGLPHLARMVGFTFMAVSGSMLLIVAIDIPFQLWNHSRQLKMSKEEVRQENKETEGDPQVKARIRQLQREAARRRMMTEVPKADVIVTNPTHYAVALSYQEGKMGAPQVVAKGAALLAQRIRELGEENRVPILESPPLARALYRHAELGQEIPAKLYTAVAEVLAYVYQLRRYRTYGGTQPEAPSELPVPPELDFVREAV